MIERCSHCHKEHETDGGEVGGMPFKVCPDMPPNEIYCLPPAADTIPSISRLSFGPYEGNLGWSDSYGVLNDEVIGE